MRQEEINKIREHKANFDKLIRDCEVKVMPTVIEGPEFISSNYETLSREEMKNCMAYSEQGRSLKKKNLEMEYPCLLLKRFFTWVVNDLDLIVYGMVVVLVLLAVVGVHSGWLEL